MRGRFPDLLLLLGIVVALAAGPALSIADGQPVFFPGSLYREVTCGFSTEGSSGGSSRPSATVQAAGCGRSAGEGRAILFLITGLGWDTFQRGIAGDSAVRLPALKAITESGAVGLMNTRTAGRPDPEDAYVTLGAGSRGAASLEAGVTAFGRGETFEGDPVPEVYFRRTGLRPGSSRVLHLGIAALRAENAALDHAVEAGALGQTLGEAGIKTALIGNGDVPGQTNRSAATVAMDAWGRVDLGAVGEEILLSDPLAPSGARTDWNAVMRELQGSVGEGARFVVIEAGDLLRLETYRDRLTPGRYEESRSIFLQEMDRFLERLVDGVVDLDQDLLLVIDAVPAATDRAAEKNLTPILMAGREVPGGILGSGTTRRQGIVANIDVAPTILRFFDLETPPFMFGRPMGVSSTAGVKTAGQADDLEVVAELGALNRLLVLNERRRWIMLRSYIVIQIAVLAAAIAGLWWKGRLLRSVPPILLFLTAVPLAFFCLPLLPLASVTGSFVAATVLAVGFTAVSMAFGRKSWLDAFIFICLATAGSLLTDLVRGAPLMLSSPFGYSPMAGARYYGIGNEFLGILLGAGIIGGTALLERASGGDRLSAWFQILVAAFLFLAMLVLIAAPRFGANLGGTVAAAVALAYTGLRIRRNKIGLREAILAVGFATAVILLTAGVDFLAGSAGGSHIGAAVRAAIASGGGSLMATVQRKLAMNLKLIRYTIWSKVFLVSLGTYALLFHRPRGVVRDLVRRYPNLGAGFSGVLVASVTALLVNDSGIVAAATTMVYATATLLFAVTSREGTPTGPAK